MGLTDPHDDRSFQRFVKFNDDGTIAAVVDVAQEAGAPADTAGSVYLDVTAFGAVALDKLTVDPAILTAHKAATRATRDADVALRVAVQQEAAAQDTLRVAVDTGIKKATDVGAVVIDPKPVVK
jgi:hypothetical protein